MQESLEIWVSPRQGPKSCLAPSIRMQSCSISHSLPTCVGVNRPVWLQQDLSFTLNCINGARQGRRV